MLFARHPPPFPLESLAFCRFQIGCLCVLSATSIVISVTGVLSQLCAKRGKSPCVVRRESLARPRPPLGSPGNSDLPLALGFLVLGDENSRGWQRGSVGERLPGMCEGLVPRPAV